MAGFVPLQHQDGTFSYCSPDFAQKLVKEQGAKIIDQLAMERLAAKLTEPVTTRPASPPPSRLSLAALEAVRHNYYDTFLVSIPFEPGNEVAEVLLYFASRKLKYPNFYEAFIGLIIEIFMQNENTQWAQQIARCLYHSKNTDALEVYETLRNIAPDGQSWNVDLVKRTTDLTKNHFPSRPNSPMSAEGEEEPFYSPIEAAKMSILKGTTVDFFKTHTLPEHYCSPTKSSPKTIADLFIELSALPIDQEIKCAFFINLLKCITNWHPLIQHQIREELQKEVAYEPDTILGSVIQQLSTKSEPRPHSPLKFPENSVILRAMLAFTHSRIPDFLNLLPMEKPSEVAELLVFLSEPDNNYATNNFAQVIIDKLIGCLENKYLGPRHFTRRVFEYIIKHDFPPLKTYQQQLSVALALQPDGEKESGPIDSEFEWVNPPSPQFSEQKMDPKSKRSPFITQATTPPATLPEDPKPASSLIRKAQKLEAKGQLAFYFTQYDQPSDFRTAGPEEIANLIHEFFRKPGFEVAAENFLHYFYLERHTQFVEKILYELDRIGFDDHLRFVNRIRKSLLEKVVPAVPAPAKVSLPFESRLPPNEMEAFLELTRSTFFTEKHKIKSSLIWQIDAPQPFQIQSLLSLGESKLCFASADSDKFLLPLLQQIIAENEKLKLTYVFLSGIPYDFLLLADFFAQNTDTPSDELKNQIDQLHQQGLLKHSPDHFLFTITEARRNKLTLVGIDTPLTQQLDAMMEGQPGEERQFLYLAKDLVTKKIIDEVKPGLSFAAFVQSDRSKCLLTSEKDRGLSRLLNCRTIAALTSEDAAYLSR